MGRKDKRRKNPSGSKPAGTPPPSPFGHLPPPVNPPSASLFTGARDPRELSGPGIAGPGGPRDRGMVLVPAERAVHLQELDVCEVDTRTKGTGEPGRVFAATLSGPVNGTGGKEVVSVTFILSTDAAAALVTQIFGIASRSGIRDEFFREVEERMGKLQAEGNLDPMGLMREGPAKGGKDQ